MLPNRSEQVMIVDFGGRKKKLPFMFVFSTYIPMFLLKFREGGLVGCIIKFCIQRVPTRNIF